MSECYYELTLTSLELSYLKRGFDPRECYICLMDTAPLVEYELIGGNSSTRGKCCTQCVPKLIVEIAQESGRNAQQAGRDRAKYDLRDALLDDETNTIIRDRLRYLERFQHGLVLRALTPEFLLFRQTKPCRQCHARQCLFRFAWRAKGRIQAGACCDKCAFEMTGYVFGATVDAKARADAASS